MENKSAVIPSERRPRAQWERMFRKAGSAADDEILLPVEQPDDFERREWEW